MEKFIHVGKEFGLEGAELLIVIIIIIIMINIF